MYTHWKRALGPVEPQVKIVTGAGGALRTLGSTASVPNCGLLISPVFSLQTWNFRPTRLHLPNAALTRMKHCLVPHCAFKLHFP